MVNLIYYANKHRVLKNSSLVKSMFVYMYYIPKINIILIKTSFYNL